MCMMSKKFNNKFYQTLLKVVEKNLIFNKAEKVFFSLLREMDLNKQPS